jgi:hypothetical protein
MKVLFLARAFADGLHSALLHDGNVRSCQHVHVTAITWLIIPLFSFAYNATVSIYTFEHKGSNESQVIKLEDRVTALPVSLPWFDWKCSGAKHPDGVLISCQRASETAETKVFCYVQDGKERRYLKLTKGDNFVSFEGRCKLTGDELRAIAKAKRKKKKKDAPHENIPVPAAPPPEPVQELQVIPPAESTLPPAPTEQPPQN